MCTRRHYARPFGVFDARFKDDTFKPSTSEAFPSVDDAVNGSKIIVEPEDGSPSSTSLTSPTPSRNYSPERSVCPASPIVRNEDPVGRFEVDSISDEISDGVDVSLSFEDIRDSGLWKARQNRIYILSLIHI